MCGSWNLPMFLLRDESFTLMKIASLMFLAILLSSLPTILKLSRDTSWPVYALSTILTKHLTEQGQMWPKYLPLATLAHNTFNSPNLANYSPYELTFGRKPKILIDIETDPDIKISGNFTEYYKLLEK